MMMVAAELAATWHKNCLFGYRKHMSPRILVLDDVKLIRWSLKQILILEGYEVDAAASNESQDPLSSEQPGPPGKARVRRRGRIRRPHRIRFEEVGVASKET
jgi:hypothetical protein